MTKQEFIRWAQHPPVRIPDDTILEYTNLVEEHEDRNRWRMSQERRLKDFALWMHAKGMSQRK